MNLLAFDYQTPERVPKEADYPAALHHLEGRRPQDNGNYWVQELLKNGLPSNKLVFGIPAFVRTWKLTKSKTKPPAKADGPGKEGEYTLRPGILGRYEVCDNENITQEIDLTTTTRKFRLHFVSYLTIIVFCIDFADIYAYTLPKDDDDGIWMAYDETQTIYDKLDYVKTNNLAGVVIYDLSMDDFKGSCNSGKYPFLRKIFSHMFR